MISLLRAKHWQIFIILISAMLSGHFLYFLGMKTGLIDIIAMFLFAFTFSAWLISISWGASRKLPHDLQSSIKPMIVCLVLFIFYVSFGTGYLFSLPGGIPSYGLVIHILSIFAIFYAMGFTAKQLIKVKLGKNITFSQYIGHVFLFWFFPIGVWLIQPAVNKLLINKNA
jgi:hypothetical protein